MELDDEENNSNNIKNKDTKNQKLTNECLKTLSENSKYVRVFTSKMATTINKQFKKKKVHPVTKYRGPLIITPKLFIDVAVYGKTSKVTLPSLKKYSLAAEYSKIIK
jgi:hypothetical protein